VTIATSRDWCGRRQKRGGAVESYLGEANVGGLLAEALTADVEAVLADETGAVGADTAVKVKRKCQLSVVSWCAHFLVSSCLLQTTSPSRVFLSDLDSCSLR